MDVSNGQMISCIFICRDYNEFASSVGEESQKMKAIQKEAVAKQVKLDEESLQRLKEAEARDKVSYPSFPLWQSMQFDATCHLTLPLQHVVRCWM